MLPQTMNKNWVGDMIWQASMHDSVMLIFKKELGGQLPSCNSTMAYLKVLYDASYPVLNTTGAPFFMDAKSFKASFKQVAS